MRVWRIKLKPLSLQLTPWQADTFFGTLCWALLYRKGEKALNDFLAPFLDGAPPLLISDGIPTGYMPAPYLLRALPSQEIDDQESYSQWKRLKKASFITEDDFAAVCRGESIEVDEEALSLMKNVSQLHSTINRITGTTTGTEDTSEMSLFQLHGWVPSKDLHSFSIFIGEREQGSMETLFPLFYDIELSGFGKKKSSGMGAFEILEEPEEWKIPSLSESANGFTSLSGFTPSRDDPTNGFWQLKVKHGKLGESFATNGFPFKKPWIRLEPGSCFYTEKEPGDVYGRMLTGLSDSHPEVLQYSFAFPVPIVMTDHLIEKAKQE